MTVIRIFPAALALSLAAAPAAAQGSAAADSGRVYELAEVEQLPSPANVADLRAALEAGDPPAQLRAGTGGQVFLSFVVGADGTVREPRIVSSTDSAFDAPSLAAIAVLRFTPGAVGGTPVATRVQIPIQWQAPPPAAQEPHAGEGVVSSTPRVEEGERVYSMSDVVASVPTYELSEVEVQPRPLNIAELRRELERTYPPELRSASYRGVVQVRFRVTAEGVPEAFTISASTDPRFNLPTIEAVRVLRFSPARINRRPVAVWVELPIQWQVN